MPPVLYTFRRCPYAIRARLALEYSGTEVELREVVLAHKPSGMLASSPKGTVPVLVLDDGTVIDESLDIMYWALAQNDPEGWLQFDQNIKLQTDSLIRINDTHFKNNLDHYKYADRHPEHSADYYRDQAHDYLQQLDDFLVDNRYLFGNQITISDMATFPFIRQFANVDKDWFNKSKYSHLRSWLEYILDTPLFHKVMKKYPEWNPGHAMT